jgi:hypothetical protein
MLALIRRFSRARAFWAITAFAGFVLLLIALRPQPVPGACVVGDVRARLAARIPEELRTALLDARRMQVGVGAAAIESWEGLGDALVVAGRAFVRTTRRATARAHALESGRFFQTSNLVYVPLGTQARATWPVEAGTTLDTLWRRLAARYPDGVLVAGNLHWQQLRHYAIARPAIDGLAILDHATHYYTQPMENSADTWAYLVGVAAPARAKPSADTLHARLLARRADGGLDLPVHVLILKNAPADPARAPKIEEAVRVGRAAGRSLLGGGTLALYPLQHLGACQDAFVSTGVGNPGLP